MFLATSHAVSPSLEAIFDEFVDGLVNVIPRLLAGIVFLTVAYLAIRTILAVSRGVLTRIYPASQRLIVDLVVTVTALFLWFGATLTLLKIVGLGEIAVSLGTAAGFIGLGVAFALKDMIADTVAGVYLLRDPDLNEGYLVEAASTTGTVTDIGLRKTRLRTADGDLIVLANRDVEKKWTNLVEPAGDPVDVIS